MLKKLDQVNSQLILTVCLTDSTYSNRRLVSPEKTASES